MTGSAWFGDRLARRAGRAGSSPLVTYYRPEAGERTELTVSSFSNWVDKTVHLLEDTGVDADARVALPVLFEHPAHWMSLVWPLACWQVGIGVHVGPRPDAVGADLVVSGPESPAPLGGETLACSLHPWGLALTDLPSGVSDYSQWALTMPDVHLSRPAPDDSPAWTGTEGVRTFAEVSALAADDARRLLVNPDAWGAVSALVRATAGAGSLVVVDGRVESAEVERIALTERARA